MLGQLSAKYESNGNPGTVSTGWGDAGGVSYGAYQLSSTMGSVQSFIRWLKNLGHSYGEALERFAPATQAFNAEWKRIAEVDPGGFGQLQHDYIKYAYYDPAIRSLLKAGYDVENKHNAIMRDVVWSRAVQYGVGNIIDMFTEAVQALNSTWYNLSYVDAPNFDADMIRSIYLNVCRAPEWTNGSPSLRPGLYARFESECAEALAQL